MGSVPAVLKSRWRSRTLVGAAKHQLVVRVRRGYMNRLYQEMVMLDGSKPVMPTIWAGINMNPWQGQWTPEGPWITLTEIRSAKYTKSTTNDNGSSTLTVVADDVAFLNTEGLAGMYHTIARGYFSPQRGIKVASRPKMYSWTDKGAANSWADVLNGGYQIELWEGYGPDGDPSVIPLATAGEDGTCVPPNAAISRTWVGIIDACALDTHPDTITITARDFAVFLTDQRVIYRNKAPEIMSPVIFADRKIVLGETAAGYGALASGTLAGYSPAGVLPKQSDSTGWISNPRSASSDTAWLEIKLPAGAYDEFYLATESPGQECYVAVNAAGDCRWNSDAITPGWINNHTADNTVPSDGSVHYVNHIKTVATGGRRFSLGGELQCSEGTVLRIYLTRLSDVIYGGDGSETVMPGYVANVLYFWAYRYGTTANAPVPVATGLGATRKAQGWVLIDDVADMARMVFMWCGFKEWDIDNFNWSIVQPFPFATDNFFIDVINGIVNQANWIFYMAAPTDHDLSIGVPTFKQQRAFTLLPQIAASVKDTDLLESLAVTWSLSDLPYSFRVRGMINTKGTTFGQDLAKRYSGTYFPPWSGIDYKKISPTRRGATMDHSERLAGLKRNYVMTQGQWIALSLNSDAECLFAAVLTAVQYALGEAVAQLQISGLPGIECNMGITVVDEGTGTNSRIWIDSIESDHSMGPNGSWHMTIGGALLDTQDLNLIAEDFAYVVFKYSMAKG